jgi:hypothetical protein
MKYFTIPNYILLSFSYSSIRKLYYTYDIKYKKTINGKIEERPILYTHRFLHLLFAGGTGIYIAPIHLINDIERIEMYARDIKPFKEDNKTEKTITFFSVLFDSHDIDDE